MKAFMSTSLVTSVAVSACLFYAHPAAADIFVLATGGEIRGELLNPQESPRRRYIIAPYAGGKIALSAAMVTDVVEQKPTEVAYEQMKLAPSDTIEGHWELAEWCRDNYLGAERDKHLQRILQLDPDHAEARRLLDYEKTPSGWKTRTQIMQERGYVRYNGRWMLPQEVKQIEQDRAAKAVSKKWYENVRRWRSWLDHSDRAIRGEEYLLAIRSPYAVEALVKNLESTKNYSQKEIFARALANVGSLDAVEALIKETLEHDDSPDRNLNEDFRYFCLDLLEKLSPPSASTMYVNALKQSKENYLINRAAIGLGRLGDRTAVQPLIDHLITKHTIKLGNANPGAMTTSFGGGPNGQGASFGTGGSPKVVTRYARNDAVLDALVELTGKDFDYDVNAWKAWYATQRPAAPRINVRRD